MVFGVCGLLPDMVRAVPVWIDDPKVQKALYVNVLLREAGEREAGSHSAMLLGPATSGGAAGLSAGVQCSHAVR